MPDSPDAADGDDGFPSLEEFLERLKTDPAFREKMNKVYEEVLAMPATPEIAPMQENARKALEAHRSHQATLKAMAVIREGQEMLVKAKKSLEPAAVREALARMEEARDILLDVREPERSRHMAAFTALCEEMRAVLREW